MIDPTKAQSKAEASFRLAEIAKTPRARELFKQLGEAYEKRARGELTAELIEQAEATPSLVPVAPLVSDAAPASEVTLVPEAPVAPEMPGEAEMPVEAETPVMQAPLVPEAPAVPGEAITESEQFLAVLKRFRADAARGD